MALIQGIVDTQKQNLKSLGIVNSGDDLTIELEVKQNGVNIEFVNPIFELLATKSDGTRVRQLVDITYIGNVVNIIGDEQLVTSPGIVTLQLIIKDNKRSSTCLFYFMCGTSLDRDIIQSISKVEVLNQLDEYVVQAFANLKEYEQRIIASDASIRNLNEDMIKAEKVRVQAEINRGNTFDNLVLKMNNAINAAIATDETLQNNEIKRIDNYNTLKAELESIKDDLILLNNNISKEEEKRVQAEIDRVNKTLEIIEKLKSTNDKVTIAEAERVTEFNNIKSELTSLKEALTTINNIANSNEEIRKTNESGRVAAEQQRVTDFEKIKSDNTSLGVALTKKVDDKIVEIEANNNTFKQGINEQYDTIVTENNNFKNQMNTDFGNAKTDYFGEDHINVVYRLNSDFDNVHQRINDSSYLDYEGSNIKADNSYYGLTKDLSIKGRTLQNICPIDYAINWVHSGTWLSNFLMPSDTKIVNQKKVILPIKPNTIYTILCNVEKNTSNKPIPINNVDNSCSMISTRLDIAPNEVGVKKFVIKTIADFSVLTNTPVFLRAQNGGATSGETIINNFIVLEGDYTNTPISQLPFDEGIYSVGESENNLINVKSIGKNLFDNTKVNIPYFNANSSGLTFSIKDNKIYVNGICTKMIDFRIFSESHYTELTKYINSLPDGTTICLSNNLGLQNYFSSKSKSTGKYSYNANSLTKSSDVIEITSFVRFNAGATFNNSELKVQVELDNTSTHFPYEENNQSYQITAPLRSLPNGVCDEIIGDDLIRRIGELNLNDIIDWNIVSTLENTINFVWSSKYNNVYKAVQSSFSLCNKVPYLRNSNEDKYHCRFNGSTPYSAFMIWIEKNKLSTQDTNGLIQWLQENPTTVYYELTEPIVTKLPKKAELKSFDGTTHFTSNNKLLPSLSVKVPSNVQAVLQDTRARNRELEIELETTTLKLKEADNILKEMDTDLIKTNWEMDDRLFEVEWALEDAGLVTSVSTFNINNKMRGSASVMALSKFEQAKIIIMSGDYDRATLEGQLSKYLKRNIIAQDEYDTLISMMDAKEIVVGE